MGPHANIHRLRAALLACAATVSCAQGGLPAPPAEHPPAAGLELVHIEANEGGSSGGHVGLAVGGLVYHFQSVDGLLVMERRSWESFRVRYSSLQNRRMRRLPIQVSDETRQAIRRGLERRRIVQARHLELLEALRDERDWIAGQVRGESPSLPVRGLALFEEPAAVAPASARQLRTAVESRVGAGELRALRSQAEAQARRPFAVSPVLDATLWQRGRWPGAAAPTVESLREILAWREALDVLIDARPLDPARVLDPLGEEGRTLTSAERVWLREARERLEDRVVGLIRSPRPDRGRALLVAMARHRAVSRSLSEDRFWTLDPMESDAPVFDFHSGQARREALSSLARDFRDAHSAARDRLSRAGAPAAEDRIWSWLEELAVRQSELAAAARDGRPIRRTTSPAIPWPRGQADAPPVLAREGLGIAAERSEANLASAQAALERIDGYRLVHHNCATELAVALAEPLGASAPEALGGRLDPASGLTFIPTLLFDRAAATLRSGPVTRVPSYRERRIASMREQENDWAVWLREGNTLTATAYGDSPHDGHFLFFTDGSPAIRPLGGALNLVYGIGQAGAGLLTWPFDGGRRLVRGARGAFYSFPELAFVNIRKGRFEYTEDVRAHLLGQAAASSD